MARSAGAPPGRAAPDLAAEKLDLTGAQVAELAKQNLNSSGALALSVSLLTGYVVTSMDLESGGPAFEGAVYGRNLWTVKCVRQTKDDPGSLHHAIRSGERSQVVQHLRNLGKDYREREMLAAKRHSSSSFQRDWPRSRRTGSSSPTFSGFSANTPGAACRSSRSTAPFATTSTASMRRESSRSRRS